MVATVLSATQRWPASSGLCPCSLPPRRSNAPHPLAVGLLFLPPKFHTRLRQHFWSALPCQRFRKRRSRACGPHSKGGGFRSVRFIECCHQLLHGFVPFSAIQRDAIFSASPLSVRFGIVFRRSRSTFVLIWRAVALDPLHFGVHPAGLLHLPHTWVRSQVSLGAPLQLAVKSLVVGVQLRDYTFRQDRSGQALSDHQGIVAQRGEDFAQHSGLFGVTGHPLHLSLELVRCDRPLPVILQRL